MKKMLMLVGILFLTFSFHAVALDGPKDVKVYYFHATKRCATCKAVESVTKETLKEHYAGKVEFIAVNREKEKKHPLIKEHKIKWQTLLIVGEEKTVDMTNDAFLTARTSPEKLKKKIQETINPMLQ